jgi:Ca-activated chloride channel family protein
MKITIAIATVTLGIITQGGPLYGQEVSASAEDVYPSGVLCAWSTNSCQRLFLPLKKTDVHIEMASGLVTATVRQRFVNDTAFPLEAMYIFPLPPDAAITDMGMQVGDRIIRSVVQEKAEAKKTYEAAKAAGKKTALLESSRPNVFETSLANFMPGETVDITISYTETAEYRKGVYDVTFPMVVGQRYYPIPQPSPQDAAGGATNDATHVNPPVLHPAVDPAHRLSLALDVYGVPVESIMSNTHRIDVTPIVSTPHGRRVVLTDVVTVPNCDFNVQIRAEESEGLETAFLTTEHAGKLHGLLTVFPPVPPVDEQWEAPARDVVFLIDTSGSMDGESIGQAKSGLKRCLGMLRPEDQFTIVRFASDFSWFTPDLRPATTDRLQSATEYVESLVADGGTEMQKALDYVLDILADSSRIPMVVLLTDGCVGNEDSLMALLAKKLHRGRLFTFGIGSAPNAFLMHKIAELGRGESRFIRSHEDVGRVMSDFFETLATPVLTDVRVRWLDEAGMVVDGHECFPHPCPDLFAGRPLQVVGAFERGVYGVEIEGIFNGAPQVYRETFAPSSTQHPSVARLFGARRVDELMFRMLRPESAAEKIDVKRGVLMTALSYQLVTRYTSRVAVEEKVSRAPDGSLLSVKVPVAPPKGWNMFNATATQDTALALLGAVCLLALGVLRCRLRKSYAT